MKLSSKKALEYLEEGIKLNPTRWVAHSKKVGEAASRIAKKLELDSEKALTLGYIHDIGRMLGSGSKHVVLGYEFLKKQWI